MVVDPSWELSATRPSDVAMSPDGTKLYAAGNDGNVRVYDLATGALLSTWDVGTDLGGIDISPDGTFLMAVEEQPVSVVSSASGRSTTITAYKVGTQTGAASSYPTQLSSVDTSAQAPFYDVAVMSNGTVLFSQSYGGSGTQPLWVLNLATGQYTKTIQSYRESAALSRSPDGSHVLVAPTDSNLLVWEAGVGIESYHDGARDSVYGQNQGVEAISEEAGLIVQFGYHIFDTHLNYMFNLQEKLPFLTIGTDVAFDATGANLYILDYSNNHILQVSTSAWDLVRSFDVGAEVGNSGNGEFGNRLLIAPDSSFFTVITASGIRIVTPAAELTEFQGTYTDDQLVGSQHGDQMFGDSGYDRIWGLGGDDVITPGPGNDTVYGGAGADTAIFSLTMREFVIAKTADGWSVSNENPWGNYSPEGSDTLIDVEALLFSDGGETILGAGSTLAQRQANQYQLPSGLTYLVGASNSGQGLRGNNVDNVITAGAGADYVNASDGGSDHVNSGDGRDVIYYGAKLDSGDTNNAGDEGGDARGDLLVIQGDYSAGLTLGGDALIDVEKFRVQKGSFTGWGDTAGNHYSYEITSVDGNVAAGGRVVVQGGSLQLGEHLTFDGSAETDGSFQMFGGHDSDILIGGAQGDHLLGRSGNDTLTGNGGDDRLRGGLGADTLDGGAGSDTFTYAAQGGDEAYANPALESTSLGYDTIIGFNFAQDRIDLPQTVSSLAKVTSGALSDASFDADLASAVDAPLASQGAVLFTASSGGHSGEMFLIVDADGNGSYQANADYVIHLLNPMGTAPSSPDFLI